MRFAAMRTNWILLLLLALGARAGAQGGGCPLLPTVTPAATPTLAALRSGAGWAAVEKALSAVDAAVKEASAANGGMAVGVVAAYSGELFHTTATGAARYSASGAAVAPDVDKTVWRIGSVTKVFTVLAALAKAGGGGGGGGGGVSLDDPVSKHLPGFTLSDDITLRALATQLSGMTREPPMPCQSDESRCNLTTAEMLPELNKGPLLWPVNVRPSYSNLGFGLLGRAMEPVYGKRYEALVEEDVCAPLGMASSGFTFTQDVLERLAVGAHGDERPSELGWANGDGGMFTTVADMGTFVEFLSGEGGTGGGLLSRGMHREWFLPRVLLPDGVSGVGMPWEMVQAVSAEGTPTGRWLFTKSGNVDRFGSLLTYEPNSKLAIWVVGNVAGSAASELGERINGIMYGAFSKLLAEDPRPPPPRAAEFTGVYVGYVSSVLSNMTITVSGTDRGQQPTAVFQWDGGGPLPANLLPGPTDSSAVLEIPTALPIPCMIVMELAWNGEVAYFDTVRKVLTLPGLLSGSVFKYVGAPPPAPPPAPAPAPAPTPTPTPMPTPTPDECAPVEVALTNWQARALVIGCVVLGVVLTLAGVWMQRRLCGGSRPDAGVYTMVAGQDEL